MATKFGLGYRLSVQQLAQDPTVPDFTLFTKSTLNITLPLTIEFQVSRHTYSSVNTAIIRIKNLNEAHRNFLAHDQWMNNVSDILQVQLQAGYGPGPQWPVIAKGNVIRGYSVREGVNFVTTLEIQDAGIAFANADFDQWYPAGTDVNSVILDLVGALKPYGVSSGAITKTLSGTLSKGVAFAGSAVDILTELANGNFWVDNGIANVITPYESLPQDILTIDAAAGLLETPLKQQSYLELKLLFEPRLAIGSVINLQSSTNATFNGLHKVVSIDHDCVISDAVSGTTITTLGLQAGVFTPVLNAVGA